MKKRASKKQRDAIKQAAHAIPDMIAQEMREPEKRAARLPDYGSASYQKRQRMMVWGVVLLMVGIVAPDRATVRVPVPLGSVVWII